MPRELRIAYFAHTLRSDWNNGNAHFLRGLMRGLCRLGQDVRVYEPEMGWSLENLQQEPEGEQALRQFTVVYPDLKICPYVNEGLEERLERDLAGVQVVILHEWNPPELAAMLVRLRERLGYRLLFHDTHHRASSSPEAMEQFQLRSFDGVLAFGQVLERIYRERYGLTRVWTLHEAADTTVFRPDATASREAKLVWIGNWGEGERTAEIREFLLEPARELAPFAKTTIYGVRYPEEGLQALHHAGVAYGGYLPNLQAPAVYARATATVHIPRQQYSQVMSGIPTIRVFEALACGIPLMSAPWQDTEALFRDGDFRMVSNGEDMRHALKWLLQNPAGAKDRALRGLETVLARHTCMHRAQELIDICEELLP
jgi:spore maturation protein CgeB